jgi:hypothetical protein
VGANVVATGSGTLDIKDLTFSGFDSYTFPADIQSGWGVIRTGSGSETQYFTNMFAGPTSFGSDMLDTFANSSSGDYVGIFPETPTGTVQVPEGYISGSSLSSTATWDNQTFDTLGVTVGTYTWTWGSGADADSFTLDIVDPVPEPSSLLLVLALGLVFAGIMHKRLQTAQLQCHDQASAGSCRIRYGRMAQSESASEARASRPRQVDYGTGN